MHPPAPSPRLRHLAHPMSLLLQEHPLTLVVLAEVQVVLPLRAEQAAQLPRLLRQMEQHKLPGAWPVWLSLLWLRITTFDSLVGLDVYSSVEGVRLSMIVVPADIE